MPAAERPSRSDPYSYASARNSWRCGDGHSRPVGDRPDRAARRWPPPSRPRPRRRRRRARGSRASSVPASGLRLERHTRSGAFFDVVGRRSAAFGYENRAMEAWAYPLKLVDDFKLGFLLEGYPLEIDGPADRALDRRAARRPPPSPTRTPGSPCARSIFAPVDEPGDRDAARRAERAAPDRRRLLPPAPEADVAGGADDRRRGLGREGAGYSITEESKRFAAVIGCPGARDVSLMPYQEEPRDVPVRFMVDVPAGPDALAPASPSSSRAAWRAGRGRMATYERLLASAPALYEKNVAHYRALAGAHGRRSPRPDPRLDTAFAWAKVGHRQGHGHQPAARHRAAGRLPDLGRERAARVRVDVRPRRAVDRARHHVLRRLRGHAHRARLPAQVPARGRQDPARDLAERVARAAGGPSTSSRGPPRTRRRST